MYLYILVRLFRCNSFSMITLTQYSHCFMFFFLKLMKIIMSVKGQQNNLSGRSSCCPWDFTDPFESNNEKSASWKYIIVYPNTKLKWWRIHTHSLSNKFLISWQAARTELFCLSLSWPPANLASNLASIRILEIHNKPVWLPRLFPEERCLSNTIKTVWTIFHREAKQKKGGGGCYA